MEEKIVRIIALCSVVFSGILLAFFSYISKSPYAKFQETEQEIVALAGIDMYEHFEQQLREEKARQQEENNRYLHISLPEGISAKDVKLENQYMDKTFIITIKGNLSDNQKGNPLIAGNNHVEDSKWIVDKEAARLEIKLDRIFEYKLAIEDGTLIIELFKPKELYDKIVVIDPGHGGKMPGTGKYGLVEKELCLDIVLRLKEMLDRTDLKVYYTRIEDSNVDQAERVALANEVEADFFISVHINADENSRASHGTEVLYSQSSKIPFFGSKELAEICQEEVVKMLGSRSRGIVKGDNIHIIRNSEIPVALIEVGFVTNWNEASLLKQSRYKQKTAEGIFHAIERAYEECEK